MNGDVGLVWWLLSVPARFVYGVAVGVGRLVFGDDGPASPPQRAHSASEAAPEGAGHPQPGRDAHSPTQNRPEETR